MAQNLLRLPPERNDTSGPSDSLLHAAADESGADITPLQHSHLQIPGWQGSSASFNYEWQPFISCLLIRWVDAIAPPLFSSPLFLSFFFWLLAIPPTSILQCNASLGRKRGQEELCWSSEAWGLKKEKKQQRIHKKGGKYIAVHWVGESQLRHIAKAKLFGEFRWIVWDTDQQQCV